MKQSLDRGDSPYIALLSPLCLSLLSPCLGVEEPGVRGPHPRAVPHPGRVLPPAVAGHDEAGDQPPELGLGRGQGERHRGVLHTLQPLLPGGHQQSAVDEGDIGQRLLPVTELQLK